MKTHRVEFGDLGAGVSLRLQRPEPSRYFDSIHDPAYRKALNAYVMAQMFPSPPSPRAVRRYRKKSKFLKNEVSARDCIQAIDQSWEVGPNFQESGDKHIVEAMELFKSIRFFWGRIDPPPEAVVQLGGAICLALGRLFYEIETGDASERRLASKRIRKIFCRILPETRGKRRNTVQRTTVSDFYYREMFRFYQIRQALKTAQGTSPRTRITIVSKNFEIPVKQLRKLFGFDENYTLEARPLSVKDMATVRTAQHFKLAPGSVSNILSR
jgi:hypothetical protein